MISGTALIEAQRWSCSREMEFKASVGYVIQFTRPSQNLTVPEDHYNLPHEEGSFRKCTSAAMHFCYLAYLPLLKYSVIFEKQQCNFITFVKCFEQKRSMDYEVGVTKTPASFT